MIGPSTAETTPPRSEIAHTAGRPPADVVAMAASAVASAACASWVVISSGRAGNRSGQRATPGGEQEHGQRLEEHGEAHAGRRTGLLEDVPADTQHLHPVPAIETNPAPVQIR
jgi:hypothetical protein